MKKLTFALALAAGLSLPTALRATVSVAHVENTTVGQFLTSTGQAIGAGGVSVGAFFNISNVPISVADAAFGTTINSWADMIAAGWRDVRSLGGSGTPDWGFPIPVSGTVSAIPIANLPANTQLYVAAFNAGSFNSATPLNSFSGYTEWAVVKDGLSPADLGTKSVLLNAVTPLIGTDASPSNADVQLASAVVAVPEPSRFLLLGLGFAGLVFRRRR